MKSKFLILFFKKIYKIKFYLILIFFLNVGAFYYFLISGPKLFQTSVLLNSAEKLSMLTKNNPDLDAVHMYNDFLINLNSRDNFIDFLNEKNYQELFNTYLNNKKISLEEYLDKNLILNTNKNLIVINNKTLPKLIFNYPENINGHDILNNYVKYSFNKNFYFHINVMIDYNLNTLKLLEQKLKVFTINPSEIHNNNELYSEFKLTILQIKNNLEELNKIDANKYNPIIDKAFEVKNFIHPNFYLFITYTIFLIIFISIVILTIKIFW